MAWGWARGYWLVGCGQPWLGACSVTSRWGWCGLDGGLCPRGRPQAWLSTVGQPGGSKGGLHSFPFTWECGP